MVLNLEITSRSARGEDFPFLLSFLFTFTMIFILYQARGPPEVEGFGVRGTAYADIC